MNKKQILSLISALLLVFLLSACEKKVDPNITESPATSPEATVSVEVPEVNPLANPNPLFDENTYPRVDGSTATIPLGGALLAYTCNIPLEEAQIYVKHNGTSNAYVSLAQNNTDLLLVYEQPTVIEDQLDEVEFEIKPIGKDALVFIANNNNTVKSLTEQQIVDIYSGKTTNWKDVGGTDTEIAAYQRNTTSGSQTLMQKLCMKNVEMMKADTTKFIGSMEDIIDAVSIYDNSEAALGYSVYYYA